MKPSPLPFLLFVLSAAPSLAQTGSLTGVARASDGTPLPQLAVRLRGPSGPRRLLTGLDGRYRAPGLSPGEYAVAVEAPGLRLHGPASAAVAEGEVRLDLTLVPAPLREHVLVTATRGEAVTSSLGASVAALDADRIAERAPGTLLDLLRELPGVATARAGGPGAQASVFVRGGESRFARVLLDGIPVNEPGGAYDFGSDLPLELERVEVVRGAASSLYGSDALAGVVQLVTRRAGPDEAPGLRAELELGSFAWRRLTGASSGRVSAFDWNAGLQRVSTDNREPNSAFRETSGAASLGARLAERLELRLLARGVTSRAGTPGATGFGRPDLDASYEREALALGARLHLAGERLAHDLRLGYSSHHQLSLDPLDSGSFVPSAGDRQAPFTFFDFPDPDGYQNRSRRLSAAYLVELSAGSRHLVTLGADLERETGAIGARSGELLRPERNNFGLFLQDRAVIGERAFLTVGGRVERNGSYGTRAVPRAALALRLRGGPDATTLRVSAGAGIKEPSFLESFGVSFYAAGNPDLRPERSRTVDLGLEQRLLDGRLRAEATLFLHEYRDQIAYQVEDPATFQGTFVNLGRTRARGLELVLEAAPLNGLHLAAQYTYLDGSVLAASPDLDPVFAPGRALLRRPRHQATLSLHAERGRVSAGASLLAVGRRADSDFLGLGLDQNAGYARLDARARARLGRGLEATLVGENLLDARYQEVLGYPALGRTLRLGVSFRSGAGRRP